MHYLRVGRASDLENPRERTLYRFLELLPGAATWLTFIGAFLLSWLAPFFISYILIILVVFWFLRGINLTFHLWSGFKRMERYRKINWLKKTKEIDGWQDIYHLIILPNWKEPLDVIEDAPKSLIESHYPKDRMIVVLSFEERAGSARKKIARKLEEKYKGKFFRFMVTFHPDDLPGEIAGHASNDVWAVKKAKEKIIDSLKIPYENIIVSSFDTDTRVYPEYFGRLTHAYLTADKPTRSSYQPVALYNNNIWRVPSFSRASAYSCTFWGLMCQERPNKLVSFSSHSMSFKALVEVGFKQPNVIADDSRIFYQCFFTFNGDYRVIPLFYPISMDANEGGSLRETAKNIYKQKKRWAYGAEDIPYFIFACIKNKKIPWRQKISRGVELITGHWTWATMSILLFALGWLPVFFAGESFNRSLIAYSVPALSSRIMTIAMIGLISSIWFASRLVPPTASLEKGKLKYITFALSWFLMPLIMIVFDALPAIEAQTRMMLGKYLVYWNTPKNR